MPRLNGELYNTINTYGSITTRRRNNYKNFVCNACNELKNPPYITIVFDKDQVADVVKKCEFPVIIESVEDYFVLQRVKN